MEKSKEHVRFSEIITKHLKSQNLTSDEKKELATIAKNNNFHFEQKDGTDCYWICRGSNWSCNPQAPAPGCDCYQVCI